MRYISPGDAAKLLGVQRITLRRWAAKGFIGCEISETGRRTYFRAEIEKLVEERKLTRAG